ncbi:carotenoid oxygenase family protein [Pseudomonas putida]|uniref:Carotenoid oxygenase family protein n=1 Tax=Pseudomonas putida TaxID=303 RepID=A0A4D6XFS7_PSEPU|nr:carotenoid oxygenase family protein [Pseudomonas putida]QCI13101.1 carotenoid oxygenase family protein [Pseudomonas putida]
MSFLFPDTVTFRGVCRPSRIEAETTDLEIEGEIPASIRGSFYRTGPDPKFPPMRGDDLFIHGDGMASRLHIENGRASYQCRYVRTPRFLAEQAAGRSIFGDYRNPYTDDPAAAGIERGTGNTNMIMHAGHLLALKEDSRMYELDPHSLETLGPWTAGGALKSPHISAHPKLDPFSGELLTFGFQAKGIASRDIAFYVIDKHGKMTRELWFEAPWAGFLHDFVVTENHVVFPLFPTTTVLEKVEAGLPYYWWDNSKPTLLGVLPRNGEASDIRWVEGPPRFGFHFFNAYEEGRRLHILGCPNDPSQPAAFPLLDAEPNEEIEAHWGQRMEDPEAAATGPLTMLTDWIIDLDDLDKPFEEVVLRDDLFIEAPRVDERYATRKARIGWALSRDRRKPTLGAEWIIVDYNCIDRYDFETGQVSTLCVGPDAAPAEPVFIPRATDSPEGDGYLLLHLIKDKGPGSEFILLDASKLEDGPIARIRVPFHLRPAIHGNWVDNV